MLYFGIIVYAVVAVICYGELYSHRLDLEGRFTTSYNHSKNRWMNFWNHLPEVWSLWFADLIAIRSLEWPFWLCKQIVGVTFAPISWIVIQVVDRLATILRPYVERHNAPYKKPKRRPF